ncbi:MAG: hypothetical protein JO003_11470 [Candidatus Eremiobacteraeota bacterium]|nr:hypothetical protein [Candidatus Eremiobacteraeota bacterium]
MNRPSEGMSPERISRMIADGVAAEAMRTVDCKVHHGKPTVTVVQAEPDGMEYAIAGCCDDLRKRTRKAIDDLLGSGLAAPP